MAVPTADAGKPWYRCQPAMVLGEAPIYRARDSTLHWVDCLKEPAELHILPVDPSHGDTASRAEKARVVALPDSVTVQFFRRDHPGSYICAYYQGVALLDEATGRLDVLREIIPTADRDKRRFNDGGIDSRGRFWLAEIDKALVPVFQAETYQGPPPQGRLWRYDPDGSLHEMDSGFVCGNGLAWSPDDTTMYVNDSMAKKIYQYDYDSESGSIANRRLLVDRRGQQGEPDGMVIDSTGNLWVAVYSSYRVMVYSPAGEHLRDVRISAYNPACPTWGGQDWNVLYIATGQDRANEVGPDDDGGHMFRYVVPDGVHGQAKHEFAG